MSNCPSCGAPIEFTLGSSIAKVCEYCRHTVVRSDRGLSALGKVADLAETPSLVAIGDEGSLAGRPFRVFGRVQLDYGKGPWDEYYVALDHGQSWAWLAHAQGEWLLTSWASGVSVPSFDSLSLEGDVTLAAGFFRVAELRTARVTSAEGELPGAFPTGFVRRYADLRGPGAAFATLDYGDGSHAAAFIGQAVPETELSVVALGPRSQRKVPLTALKCPNCGGDVPALSPDRSERLGCPYCGAISDIAERRVIAQQERAREQPVLPIGSRGTLEGVSYLCLAQIRRGSDYEGELYEWEEFLLYAAGVGYRFLVLDPETGWSFVTSANLAELDFSGLPNAVHYDSQRFTARNRAEARVTFVLGEVYWACELGETVRVADFTAGERVLSREQAPGEVSWSLSTPLSWQAVAEAFNLPLARHVAAPSASKSHTQVLFLVVVIALVLCGVMALAAFDDSDDDSTTSTGYRGGGVFYGGK